MIKRTIRGVVFIILILAVAGCATETRGWQIDKMIDYCQDKGGIDYIDNRYPVTAWCRKGGYISVDKGSVQ